MGGVGFVYGIIMLVAGIVQIFSNKKNKDALTTSYVMSAFLIVYGIALLSTELWATELLFIGVFIGGGGLMLILLFLISVYNTFSCTEKVEAEFVGTKHNAKSTYMPVFRYRYESEEYEKPSVQAYTSMYLSRHYTEGKMYEIYVCPTKPSKNVPKRRFLVPQVFVAVLGVAFFTLGFAMLIV